MSNRTDLPIRPSYDVVVVGARAAGASTAMLLARRGLSVLAVDRTAYGSDTLSTHSLAPAGVLQLSRWGVLDAIRKGGTPVASRVVFHYGDDLVEIDVPARGDVDGLYSPRRTLLDRTLVDAAVDAGADVRHGVSMVGLLHDAGRVAGVQLEVDGELRCIAARAVIGADGVRSRVAEHVGAQTTHQEAATSAVIYSHWEGLPDDVIVNHYGSGKVAGSIPTNDGAAVVWVGMHPDEFRASARGNVAEAQAARIAELPRFVAELEGARCIGGYRAWPGQPGFVRQGWGAGWALVGDAGYFKDPVSAHGITDALIGAELVADAVADSFAGADEAEAFGRFERERDAMAARMMPPVARIASLPDEMGVVMSSFVEMTKALHAEWNLIESNFGAVAAV
ncbi:MAG: NAD(P)/FAD-dependent oxidoreductase [Ilumatobacter sp.]|uniref:NAD(P)/FAD-dependent oxidoreductase n=1 Tax=Ilumatobacter sp. TaxID=1967498 RepID=UPI00261F21CD|nr:NAD(P)/FAD-dependent oxidoreductase [Ilumatobacter sp.]MDJ0768512.1 NAD(P)/FAD-dependent oxidoreductase [Ilumatobacter sp.]